MKKKIKRILWVVGVIVFFLILVGVLYLFNILNTTTTIQSAFPIPIPPGSSMSGGG